MRKRDVLQRPDLLVPIALLDRHPQSPLEQLEPRAPMPALHLRLPPRNRRIARRTKIASLLCNLERLAEITLRMLEIPEIRVALANRTQLLRDARSIPERLVDLQGA